MVRFAFALIISTCSCSLSLAADETLSPAAVIVASKWGSTMSEALTDSHTNLEACGGPRKLECRNTAPTIHQVVFEHPTCAGGTLQFGWRDQNDLRDGPAFIQHVEKLAESRKVFDCNGGTCLTVARTIPPNETDKGARHFSVCEVTNVRRSYGPPTRCEDLVARNDSARLVIAVIGQERIACEMGLPDFDAVFKDRGKDLASIRALVGDALKGKPFELTVAEDGEDVLGTRAYHPSEIISGWREWVTVRVTVAAHPYETTRDATATIATTILVSKQNSPDRESWTAPSQQQEETYLAALRNELSKLGGELSYRHFH